MIIAKKILKKTFTVSSQWPKMWWRDEKMTDFSRFFGRCDLVFEHLKKNLSPQYKLRTRWDVRAKFGANRSRHGWETLVGEKRKRKKQIDEKT